MFRSGRWRSEKNKIKAVFKLQFHATQVAQIGIDALMVSVIPADVGKPTAKLEKAVVRDGSCYWENPVLVTVKFDREAKSGKILERIYKFVVATGSSKSGVVGEASIDFSNYAEATKVSSVSLPLKNSKFEILLHVSIQKLQESVDQRQFEESENLKDKVQDKSLRVRLNNGDMDDANLITNTMEDGPFNKKVPQTGDLNLKRRTSSGSDVTMSSSDCSSSLDTPAELQLKDRIHQDPSSLFSSLNNDSGLMRLPSDGALATICDEPPNTKWGWLGGSDVDVSTDDSSSTPREAIQRTISEDTSDIVVENLRAELTALARQAEVSDLELQTLRKQIVKESKKGQDLSKEVISLKKERDSLRENCEKLKGFKNHLDEAKSKHMSQLDGGDLRAIIEELRQELHFEKDLNANLRMQLQKTQESNSELLLAVGDLDEMLEQKDQELLQYASKSGPNNTQTQREENSMCESDDDDYDDEEQKALEQLVKEHRDAKESYLMEQRILDLNNEIETYRREKDELEVQMEQLALDYEILKQEHHDMSYKLEQGQLPEQLKVQYESTTSHAAVTELESQIEKLENKLKKQEHECSKSLSTISEFEYYVKDLEEEMEKQAQGFEADLEALTGDKVEQEKRAIKAEESLRKTRWQNTNTAERLQGELRRLSMQMSSTFEANEKLATKAMMEASELRLEKDNLQDMLQKSRLELESLPGHYEERLHELSNQVISLSNGLGEMNTEIKDKSMKLESQEKLAEETYQLLSEDILKLKDDIDDLSKQNTFLSEQADKKERLIVELECMQKSIIEMEMLIEQGNKEIVELENNAAIMKKEAAQSREEINNMRLLKDEKESIIAKLQGQVDTLEAQCDELRCSRYDNELEKEQLLKQVSQFKADLGKKEDVLKSMEKKLKDDDHKTEASDVVRKIPKSNKSVPVPYGPKEIAHLKEKIRLLEGQIKQREADLETSTTTFLEKEKELQNQIEDLAKTLEVLNQKSTSFSECIFKKVAVEKRSVHEYGINAASTSNENNRPLSSQESHDSTNEGPKCYSTNERNVDELDDEVAQLKERNKLMEDELKDMQERYSEISLKFAEVEGERQQLVMRVRNLKNAKKS
ncbi:hypothetical protein Leryth_003232 [Lithospermum erythrorhizon]|nr:hypothetical protein Leryth_003232 [Lithospermum erythrorhizon]